MLPSLVSVALLYLVALCASHLHGPVSTLILNDSILLNYFLTIEYLQQAFYEYGLSSFSHLNFTDAGFVEPFYENAREILNEQNSHVDLLVQALKAADYTQTTKLEYAFPVKNIAAWVALADIIQSVVISAYLGAIPSLIDRDYIVVAGSILAVESRQAAYIAASLGQLPFPNAFATPLPPNEVHSIAIKFITKNPNPVHLPFQAFPDLDLRCSPYYYEEDRSSIVFANAYISATTLGIGKATPIFAIFFSGLMRLPVQVRIIANKTDYRVDRIPKGILGQVYVVLSLSDLDVRDGEIIAGPAIIQVYPKGQTPSVPKIC